MTETEGPRPPSDILFFLFFQSLSIFSRFFLSLSQVRKFFSPCGAFSRQGLLPSVILFMTLHYITTFVFLAADTFPLSVIFLTLYLLSICNLFHEFKSFLIIIIIIIVDIKQRSKANVVKNTGVSNPFNITALDCP